MNATNTCDSLARRRHFFKSNIITCLLLITGLAAMADAVLVPSKYHYQPKESPVLQLVIGGYDLSEKDSPDLDQVQQLMHYAPDGHDYDLQVDSVNHDLHAIKTAPLAEGTQMVILHSRNISGGPLADSLSAIISRTANQTVPDTAAQPGYQLSLKTIFQAGKTLSNNCLLSTSLPLDIVPEKNPYSLSTKRGKIGFRLLFKGLPVSNATLRLTHTRPGQQTPQVLTLTTDKKGRIKAVIDPSGEWTITAVKLAKPLNNTMAGWQYYLASVTWGYQPASAATH